MQYDGDLKPLPTTLFLLPSSTHFREVLAANGLKLCMQ